MSASDTSPPSAPSSAIAGEPPPLDGRQAARMAAWLTGYLAAAIRGEADPVGSAAKCLGAFDRVFNPWIPGVSSSSSSA